MSTTKTTTIPTINNWSELEQRVFYKGTQVTKSNKSTAVPKPGAQPLFHYVNKSNVVGDWYDVKDVAIISKEDKQLAKDINKQLDDIWKDYKSHRITKEAFDAKEAELQSVLKSLAQ